MLLPDSIRENLLFLLAETSSQVENLRVLLETASHSAAQRILDRRGYAYNLKMRIHNSCIKQIQDGEARKDAEVRSLRAAGSIASRLERFTDLGRDCVRMVDGQRGRIEVFKKVSSAELVDELLDGIQLIGKGLKDPGTETAVKIGNSAHKLSTKCDDFFESESRRMAVRKHPDRGVPALIVVHRVKDMSSALLEISEALISVTIGAPVNIERYRSFGSALEDLDLVESEAAVKVVAETKSGSGISGITRGDEDEYVAILKDGQKKKLKEERNSVESWHEIFPGLAPQILSYRKRGGNASLLIEHLPGFTFEQILLNEDSKLLQRCVKHLTKTLKKVWNETRKAKPVSAGHMKQLRKRLPSVRKLHPEFMPSGSSICGVTTQSMRALIDSAEEIENSLHCPFSVYIHGDFNIDNIIFDPGEKRINFVDLHRSCFSDYVQDVSVFMVSNYRLQVIDEVIRMRIGEVALAVFEFAAGYADKHEDDTFSLRMAMGLARSFITSTRFILDRALAKAMYLRGYYILERIHDHGGDTPESFTLPISDIF